MEACGSVSMSLKENKQLKFVFMINVQKQRPFILFFLSLTIRNVEGSRDVWTCSTVCGQSFTDADESSRFSFCGVKEEIKKI